MKKIGLLLVIGLLSLQANDFYYENGKKVMVVKALENRSNDNISYYQNSLGKKIGVQDEIILKCKQSSACATTLQKYNFLKIEKLSDTLLLVKIAENQNIFKVSQSLYNEPSIEFAHPNFTKERTRR